MHARLRERASERQRPLKSMAGWFSNINLDQIGAQVRERQASCFPSRQTQTGSLCLPCIDFVCVSVLVFLANAIWQFVTERPPCWLAYTLLWQVTGLTQSIGESAAKMGEDLQQTVNTMAAFDLEVNK